MQLLSFLSAAVLLAQGAVAAPRPEDATASVAATSSCSKTLVRKEWYASPVPLGHLGVVSLTNYHRRALTKKEQLDYLAAVQCLQQKPAKTGSLYPGVKSRYDDFQAVHIAMTERIHFVVRPLLCLMSY